MIKKDTLKHHKYLNKTKPREIRCSTGGIWVKMLPIISASRLLLYCKVFGRWVINTNYIILDTLPRCFRDIFLDVYGCETHCLISSIPNLHDPLANRSRNQRSDIGKELTVWTLNMARYYKQIKFENLTTKKKGALNKMFYNR